MGLGIEVAGGLTLSLQQSMQYFATIIIQDSILRPISGNNAGNSVVHLHSTNCHITLRNASILNGNSDLSYYAGSSFSGGIYIVSGQFVDDQPFTKYLHVSCTFAGLYGAAMCVSSIVDDFETVTTA